MQHARHAKAERSDRSEEEQTLIYIADLLDQLEKMAAKRGHETLANKIQLAVVEAREMASERSSEP